MGPVVVENSWSWSSARGWTYAGPASDAADWAGVEADGKTLPDSVVEVVAVPVHLVVADLVQAFQDACWDYACCYTHQAAWVKSSSVDTGWGHRSGAEFHQGPTKGAVADHLIDSKILRTYQLEV